MEDMCYERLRAEAWRYWPGTGIGIRDLVIRRIADEIAARLPCTPHPEVVSRYAQLIGELMFIAINTQLMKPKRLKSMHA
jgi:hypothetical protein